MSDVAGEWSLFVGPLSEYCWKKGIGSANTRAHAVWKDVSSSRPLKETEVQYAILAETLT